MEEWNRLNQHWDWTHSHRFIVSLPLLKSWDQLAAAVTTSWTRLKLSSSSVTMQRSCTELFRLHHLSLCANTLTFIREDSFELVLIFMTWNDFHAFQCLWTWHCPRHLAHFFKVESFMSVSRSTASSSPAALNDSPVIYNVWLLIKSWTSKLSWAFSSVWIDMWLFKLSFS